MVALNEPFSAFPSWFLRITCDRCGKDRMVNESHAPWRDRTLRQILGRMRHDGCGGVAGKAELLTGIARPRSAPKFRTNGNSDQVGICARSYCNRKVLPT